MRKGVAVALVFALVGVAMVALAVPSMGPDVVARGSIQVEMYQMMVSSGPHELPSGSFTVWMEVNPNSGDGRWHGPVSLTDEDMEPVGELSFDDVTREIEGVTCYPALTTERIPEGDYTLWMEPWGEGGEMPPTKVRFFVVRDTGTWPGVLLVAGAVLAGAGGILAIMLWLGRPEPVDARGPMPPAP